MKPEVEIVDDSPGWRVGIYRNALFMLWRENISVEGLNAIDRAGKRLTLRHPTGQAVVSISERKVLLPDGPARAEAARLMAGSVGRVAVSVTVLEGDGFAMSAGRMVMATLMHLSRTKTKVARDLSEAAGFIHSTVVPTVTLPRLVSTLEEFRM